MEIKYFAKLLVKWLWLILLLPAVAGAGAYYVNIYKSVPYYEAEATLYIIDSAGDAESRTTAVFGDISSAQNAISNYSELIESKVFINQALEELNLSDYSAERFAGNISLEFSNSDSFVVWVKVQDTDPVLASDMTNKLSEIFVDKANTLMKMTVIEILDKADVPTAPVQIDKSDYLIAVAASFVFCVTIIFIVEYFQSIILKDDNDVKKYLKLPVLAVIPNMKYIKTLM